MSVAYTVTYRVAVVACDLSAQYEGDRERVVFRTEGQREDDCRHTHLTLHRAFDGQQIREDIPVERFFYSVRLECVRTPIGEMVDTVDTDTMFGAWNDAEYRAYRDHGTIKNPSGFASELDDEEDV